MIISEYSHQVIEAMVKDIQMSLKNINTLHRDNIHPDVADLLNQIDFSVEEIERRMYEG
jgi:hypothetical protein